MNPKHILITGSTDGIGKLAASRLARDGHHLYIHGRDYEKLQAVKNEIEAESENPVQAFLADFSELKAVQKMVMQVREEVPRLDVLINNAGVYNSTKAKNKEGIDLRFQVNYVSAYMLTHRILQVMERSDTPRIINVSSAAQSPVDLDALQGRRDLTESEAYAQSKLAMIMWTFDMAGLMSLYDIITVNPGSLLDTNMVREAFGKSWSPAKKGSDILCDLAVNPKYIGQTGKYFDNDSGDFKSAHPDAYDTTKIQNLIDVTDNIIQS